METLNNNKQTLAYATKTTSFGDFNVVVIVLLLLSSVLSLVAHRNGLMEIKLNLQSPDVFSYTTSILDGDVVGEIKYLDGQFQTKCTHLENSTAPYNNCGISIGLGPEIEEGGHDITKGINLEKYDRISLKVTYISPSGEDRVKLSFRHYDPLISNPDDFVSLKFNSVVYLTNNDSTPLNIPLKSFKVDDWWLKSHKVTFENAQLDFSNIVFVELVSDEMKQPGEYFYRIDSAVLFGELITELQLLQIIFLASLITILLLVFRQSKLMESVSKTDSLTGLLNRRGIEEEVTKQCHFQQHGHSYFFYFDVDGFKAVNDTHGHQIGDYLLVKIADIIYSLSSKVALNKDKFFLARLGGDEFCVLINELPEGDALATAQNIIDLLSLPMEVEGRLIKVGVSVGIVKMESSHNNFSEVLEQADTAMYVAKKEGKNCYRLFNDKVKTVIYESKRIAAALKSAIDDDQLALVFMPIIDAQTQRITKAEVLLRTSSSELDNIGPDVFIPVAEEFGIIQRIDLWVIEHAMMFIKQNMPLIQQQELVVAINISSKEMNNLAFYNNFKSLLQRYEIPPHCIELEITETSFAEVDQISIETLSKLRALGVSLSLDDFGTGYSAFQHIERYPVESLKIDKSFIDKYQSHKESDRTIITAIISIAHSHGLKVVAEGVESADQVEYLLRHKCDLLQGYYFSKPLHQHVFIEMLNAQR